MGFLTDMTQYLDAVNDIDVSDVYATTVDRLRYDRENNTSNSDDPLYGLPLDTKPSALYYNESMFEKAGIIVISVDEENLDAWNDGKVADNRGKTRADYEAEHPELKGVTVPNKGYYRSIYPYTVDVGWTYPDENEVLVFNNRIAMNYLDRHRSELNKQYPKFDRYKQQFQVTEEMMQELISLAENDKIKFDEAQYNRSKPLIMLQIKALIARDLYDMGEYFQVINDDNPSFQEALRIINDEERYNKVINN